MKKDKISEQLELVEKQSFDITSLQQLQILDGTQIQQLKEIKNDLMMSSKKLQIGRPKYLMEVSVLKDMRFPTPDSKYWQCILERNVQFQNMLSESLDFEEKIAELEEKEAEIEELQNDNNTRKERAELMKLDVQRRRVMLQLFNLKKQGEERYREIMAWTDLINQVKPELKYTEDNPEEHMPESFLIRMANEKHIIDQIGAADMNGAMNIIGLGQSASRYLDIKNEKYDVDDNLLQN